MAPGISALPGGIVRGSDPLPDADGPAPAREPTAHALNVSFGSVFAVQHSLTAARHDAAVHEAGIGQFQTFTAASRNFCLRLEKQPFTFHRHR